MTGEPDMRRREFVGLVGGAAVWPLAARAQQRAMPVIGVLNSVSRDGYEFGLSAFAEGLRRQGYVEDRNVSIQYSWADGHFDLLPSMAAEFVRRRVAVIVTLQGTIAAQAARAATSTIPIVFALGSDPVAAGLVKSLNRPDGNLTGATGITVELGQKRLELVHDLVPKATKIGFLTNPGNRTYSDTMQEELQTAAAKLGKEIHAIPVAGDGDLDTAFQRLSQLRVGALLVSNDPYYWSRRGRIIGLAARHRIPTVYSRGEYARAGGLMSYGASSTFTMLVAGEYTGRILKGERLGDLPVVQPATLELVINLKAAKALDLDFSPFIAARATEIIE